MVFDYVDDIVFVVWDVYGVYMIDWFGFIIVVMLFVEDFVVMKEFYF